MTAICKFIYALITLLSSTTFRFCVNREKPFLVVAIVAEFVTHLLKVVDTCFWAQSDCNILQVYWRTIYCVLFPGPCLGEWLMFCSLACVLEHGICPVYWHQACVLKQGYAEPCSLTVCVLYPWPHWGGWHLSWRVPMSYSLRVWTKSQRAD